MSVLAFTDIYFNKREEFYPILETLFSCGWEATEVIYPNSFTWFPPGVYDNSYTIQNGVTGDIGQYNNDMTILPSNRLEEVLEIIRNCDKDKTFSAKIGIILLCPYHQISFNNDHLTKKKLVVSDTLLTGGIFVNNYSSDEPHLSCIWDVNQLWINGQKGDINFTFYHEKLKNFFDLYQDRIKEIRDGTDW
jgi:hypothetical protein